MDELFDLTGDSQDASHIHWASQVVLAVGPSAAEALLHPFVGHISPLFNVTGTDAPEPHELSTADLILITDPQCEELMHSWPPLHKPVVLLFEPSQGEHRTCFSLIVSDDSHTAERDAQVDFLKALMWSSYGTKLDAAAHALSREAVVTFSFSGSLVFANPSALQLLGIPPSAVQSMGSAQGTKTNPETPLSDFNFLRLFTLVTLARGDAHQTAPLPTTASPDTLKKWFSLSEIELERVLPNATKSAAAQTFRFQRLGADAHHATFLCTDISKQVELRQQLEQERALVVQAGKLAAMGEVVAKITHEINNPLTLISARCEQMLDLVAQDDFAPLKDLLEKQNRQIERVKHIVKSLASHGRNAGQDPMVATSLKSLFDSVTELIRFKIDKRNIAILLPSEDLQKSIFINCRPSEISQIFVNIISNSIDAVENLEAAWVRVETQIQHKQLIVTFLDSGTGVPVALRENIWKPFFTTKSPGKGTGLGLPISKTIAKNHSGDLELKEIPNGTCFVLTLPQVDSNTHPEDARVTEPEHAPGTEGDLI